MVSLYIGVYSTFWPATCKKKPAAGDKHLPDGSLGWTQTLPYPVRVEDCSL